MSFLGHFDNTQIVNNPIVQNGLDSHNLGLLVDAIYLKENKLPGKPPKKIMPHGTRKVDTISYDTNSQFLLNLQSKPNPHINCLVYYTGVRNSPLNIFVIDIDKSKSDNIQDGLHKWAQLIETHGEIDTWISNTGNGGLHYFFKIDDRLKDITIGTNAKINGTPYSIDWRGNGGLIYAPPTQYHTHDNTMKKKYTWKRPPNLTELAPMPNWLFDLLKPNWNKTNITKTPPTKPTKNNQTPDNTSKDSDTNLVFEKHTNFDVDISQVKYLTILLSKERATDYTKWLNVGIMLYNISPNEDLFNIFDEFSQKCPEKYPGRTDLYKKWKKLITKSNKNKTIEKNILTFGSLIHWVKEDNPDIKLKKPLRNFFQEAEQNNFFGIEVEKIEQRYLPDLEFGTAKTLFVKSGQGTNKTGQIVKLVNKIAHSHLDYKGLIGVASRCNLITTLVSKFKNGYYGYKKNIDPPLIDVENYQNVPAFSFSETDNLFITPNSLPKIAKGGKIPLKTILVIDEITPFLEYLCSPTLANCRIHAYDILEWYIKSVEYLVISDADISDDVLKIIMKIRNQPAKMIWNTYPADENIYIFVKAYEDMIKYAIKLLNEGKNIYFCTDTKAETKKIAEYLKDFKPLIYNSDTSAEGRDKLMNIEEEWSKERVIITNSVNEYGVSYDDSAIFETPHFHTIFSILHGNTITAQGANQLFHRVRHTVSSQIYIHLDKVKSSYGDTSLHSMKLMVQRGEQMISDILCISDLDNTKQIKIDDDGNFVSINDNFNEILARVCRSRFESRYNFREYLEKYITLAGGTIMSVIFSDTMDISGEADIEKDVNITAKDIPLILNAKEIKRHKFLDLMNKKVLEDDERYSIIKYLILDAFGIEKLTMSLVIAYVQRQNIIRQLKNFRKYLSYDWKQYVINKSHDDYLCTMGTNSDIAKFKLIHDMLKIMGWSPKINLTQEKTYRGGTTNADVLSNEILAYYKKHDKLLRNVFGNSSRISYKNTMKTIQFMDMLKNIINETFGEVMVKDVIRHTVRNGNKTNKEYAYKYRWNYHKGQEVDNNLPQLPALNINTHFEFWLNKMVRTCDTYGNNPLFPVIIQKFIEIANPYTQYHSITGYEGHLSKIMIRCFMYTVAHKLIARIEKEKKTLEDCSDNE